MPDQIQQVQSTELFILFPEYVTEVHSASAVYIHSVQTQENGDIPSEVDDILNMMEFFDYEWCTRYYDGKNLSGLLHPYTENQYPNVDTVIYSRLQAQGCLDWRDILTDDLPNLIYQNIPLEDDSCGQVYYRGTIDTQSLKRSTVLLAPSSVLDKNMLQKRAGCEGCCCVQHKILLYQGLL